ncbi:MAG: R3H domain-containing nucleic acid-binding protein [Patescibacteria group bacterium]
MDKTQTVIDTTTNFLAQMGFADNLKPKVSFDAGADRYLIVLETDNPALLIGYHGNTLSGLQLFLGQHLHQALGEWINLTVDVNDYRQRREQSLKTLADSTVEKVLETNQAYILPPMPASERRVVHVYLAEHPQVSTASSGVGRERSVIISPKV